MSHSSDRASPLGLGVVALVAWAAFAAACGTPRSDDGVRDAVLAISTPLDASTTTLRRLDADTLAPAGGGVDLGEFHGAWAVSPDRRVLAAGTFARTGVRVIDPESPRIVRDIPMPVAVTALGWIAPDRIAALLQRGGVVLIDTRRGRIARRWPFADRACGGSRQAVTPHGVVFIVTGPRGAVRLLRVDERGRLRHVPLSRIRSPSSPHSCGSAALAVDPSGRRAVVAASHGPLAEIDLGSLRVTYHSASGLRRALGLRSPCRPRGSICTARVASAWLDADTLATGVLRSSDRRGARPVASPGGVAIVDTRTWSARTVDRDGADLALLPDGTVLSFGGRRAGMRAIAPDGRTRWTALPGHPLRSVTATATRVYAIEETGTVTHVLDADTGARIATGSTPLARLDILTGRSHSGDPRASPAAG